MKVSEKLQTSERNATRESPTRKSPTLRSALSPGKPGQTGLSDPDGQGAQSGPSREHSLCALFPFDFI